MDETKQNRTLWFFSEESGLRCKILTHLYCFDCQYKKSLLIFSVAITRKIHFTTFIPKLVTYFCVSLLVKDLLLDNRVVERI